jgi:hypothetical protein
MKSKTTTALLLTSLMGLFGTAYAADGAHDKDHKATPEASMGTDDGTAGGSGAGVNTGPGASSATGMPDDDRANEGTENAGASKEKKN